MTNTYAVLILSAAVVLAGLLAGGRYEGVETHGGSTDSFYLVNRITGTVYHCQQSVCRPEVFP
jgi:hypothetical protein